MHIFFCFSSPAEALFPIHDDDYLTEKYLDCLKNLSLCWITWNLYMALDKHEWTD